MDERTCKGMGSSESDEWFTPKQEFLPWHRKYNFETDPATAPHNPLGCPVFFTKETNGLDWRKWQGNVWINPPYHGVGTVEKWIRAAIEYHRQTRNVVVMLLAARVETKRFHEYFWDKDRNPPGPRPGIAVHFIDHRVTFEDAQGKPGDSAFFPSMVVVIEDHGGVGVGAGAGLNNNTQKNNKKNENEPARQKTLEDFSA